jgi:uncharacterized protein
LVFRHHGFKEYEQFSHPKVIKMTQPAVTPRSIMKQMGVAITLGFVALAACSSPELAQAKGEAKGQICAPAKVPEASPAGLSQEVICLKTGGKTVPITVEIAATPQEQAKGLMFRTELAPDKGMLFPFSIPKQASFWMKNTYIPLDIVYVQSDGVIESIASNTEPTSLTPVLSKGKVGYVLELAGGRAAQLGLRAGDTMRRLP